MIFWKQKSPPRQKPGTKSRKENIAMTAQEAIKELQNIKNYCTASALPALDYAIAVLKEKKEQQEKEAE